MCANPSLLNCRRKKISRGGVTRRIRQEDKSCLVSSTGFSLGNSFFGLLLWSNPLFGPLWQVSFSLRHLCPQGPAFSLEVNPARCPDPGFFVGCMGNKLSPVDHLFELFGSSWQSCRFHPGWRTILTLPQTWTTYTYARLLVTAPPPLLITITEIKSM